jgi:hypothetical protein
MPVPRKVWLHTSVMRPAALARRRTICQALVRCHPHACARLSAKLAGNQGALLP